MERLNNTISKTGIEGLYYIERPKFDDERGFFREVANIRELEEVIGHEFRIVQFNQSRSEQNVGRGIHAEGWNKLITVASGVAYCVYVDVRPESETFGRTESFVLGMADGALPGAVYLEKGIGNSFVVVDGPVDYLYIVDALYADRDKSQDRAISMFDPDLAIDWPIPREEMILSDRDLAAIGLRELLPEKYDE